VWGESGGASSERWSRSTLNSSGAAQAQARFVLRQRAMLSWQTRKSWPLTFSALSFLPAFGVFPKQCEGPNPGGHGGSAGALSSAGESQGGDAAAGGAGADSGGDTTVGGDASSAGDGGSAGAPNLPDRVVEPLLGCVRGVSGKTTPGVFQALLNPSYESLAPDYPWITDWSGDGQTAVGYFTNEPWQDDTGPAYGAFFIRWRNGQGYDMEAKTRIELSQFNETQTALVNCDASVSARIWGDGSYTTNNDLRPPYDPEAPERFHQHMTLSEDGSSLSFLTGIPGFKSWTEWHSTKGDVKTVLLDIAQSMSWDGETVFGTSYCYYQTCEPPKTYRWRPLEGGQDVTTTAPSPIVAADGQSIVFSPDPEHLGIWRDGAVETVDCAGACSPIAWSSRAQVLLVNLVGGPALWTRPHGFRPLASLLEVPSQWSITPTGLSLDGWTVTGSARNADTPFAYFRATLKANAFQ
jgi:hypothetical protein